MLLYTTENDIEENGADGKGSPLKSVGDDVDMIQLEEEKEKTPSVVDGEAAEGTVNRGVAATPAREKKFANSISPNDTAAFNTFEPNREAVEKDLVE